MKAQRQQCGAIAVGEESEVADADEAGWQQVEQEAAQELIDSQSHEPLLVAVGGVSPAEGDVAIGESDQPAVGDGDAMCVGSEVAQHVFRPAEGPLGVDDPVISKQYPQPCGKDARVGEWQKIAVELEFALMEGFAKSVDELATEYAAENANGQEEGAPRGDPVGMIWSQTAGGRRSGYADENGSAESNCGAR